jgi:hypothetical protein
MGGGGAKLCGGTVLALFASACLFTSFEDRLQQISCAGEPETFCAELAALEATNGDCRAWRCHPTENRCALLPLDEDGDGFSSEACARAGEPVDCNDDPGTGAAALMTPDGIETCDGVDNDCDGDVDEGVYVPGPAIRATTDEPVRFLAMAGRPGNGEVGLFTTIANEVVAAFVTDLSQTSVPFQNVPVQPDPDPPQPNGIAVTPASQGSYVLASGGTGPDQSQLRVRSLTSSGLTPSNGGVLATNEPLSDLAVASDGAGGGVLVYPLRAPTALGQRHCEGSPLPTALMGRSFAGNFPVFKHYSPLFLTNDLHPAALAPWAGSQFFLATAPHHNQPNRSIRLDLLIAADFGVGSIAHVDRFDAIGGIALGEPAIAVSPRGEIAIAFRRGCDVIQIIVRRYEWTGTTFIDKGEVVVYESEAEKPRRPAIAYREFSAGPGHLWSEWFVVWEENQTRLRGARLDLAGNVLEIFPVYDPGITLGEGPRLAPGPGKNGISVGALLSGPEHGTALIPFCQGN